VPRGVACREPGGPGSAWTGPKVILPADWSHVMCLVRSTQAVAVAGQDWRSNGVIVSEIGWVVGVGGGSGRRAASPTGGVWECWVNAVVLPMWGDAMAAPITTAADAVPTVVSVARRRAEWRLLAWLRWVARALFGLRGACLLLAAPSVTTPGPLGGQTCSSNYLGLAHLVAFSRENRGRGGRRVARGRSDEKFGSV